MNSQTYRLSVEVVTESAKSQLNNLKKALEDLEKGSTDAGKDLDKLAKETKELAEESQEASKKQKDLANAFDKVALAAGVGFTAMSGVIGLSVKQSMELETAMAGLTKVVDFDTPDGLLNMRREFEKLSTTIPVSTAELFEMAAAGGQLGVPAEKLKEFTVLTAQMATAFDMTADAAGDSMAKLANIFGKPIEQMGEFGDMINTVSNNMPAKASEIVESLTRIGGSAKAFGLAEQEAVALSSAMISLGKAPEVASTGINSMITTLSTLDTKDKDVSESLKQMGIDATEFGNRIKTDGYGAIMQLLEGIGKLPKDQQIGAVTDLFGKNFGDDIVQLAGAPDVLAKINALLAEQQNYVGSMAKEAENVSNTSAAQSEMFTNAVENASAAFGDSFKPALASVQEILTPLLENFAKFAQENPMLVAGIAGVVTGVLGLIAGLGAVVAILPTMVAGFTLLTTGFAAISLPIVGVAVAIGALVAAGVYLYKNWDTVKAKAEEIWFAIGEIVANMVDNVIEKWEGLKSKVSTAADSMSATARTKFNELKTTAQTVFQSLPAPVQTALGVMGNVFRTHFNLIKNVVQTVFNTIKALVRGDMEGVKTAISNGIQNAWNIVKTGVGNIAKEFLGLGSKLKQAGTDAIQGLIDGISSRFNAVRAKVSEIAGLIPEGVRRLLDIRSPSRVMRELGAWAGEGFVLGVSDKVADAKQVAENLANALTSTVQDLHRQNFMLTNHANPLADLDYKLQFGELAELTAAQKARVMELAQANHKLSITNANNEAINKKIAEINEKILLTGKSELEILQYQLDHAKEYQGVSNEIKQTYLDRTRALQDEVKANERLNALEKARDDFAKQQFISQNPHDKYAGERFDLQKQGFNAGQIDELLGLSAKKDAFSAFQGLQNTLRQAMPKDPMADLEAQYAKNLEIIRKARESQLGLNAEFDAAELELSRQFLQAKNELMLTTYEQGFGAVAGIMKSAFGEQSGIYKAMFAMEKGMALSRILLNNKVALSQAWADPTATTLFQKMANVAAVAIQTGALQSAIGAIRPVIGQAHDGIMSVPKSGTWNLEKGERVLPKHTARALDDKLNSMGSAKAVNVIIHNHTGEKVRQTTDSNGDIRVIIGQELAKQLPQHVNNPYSDFNKSLKQNYNLERKL